MIQQTEYLSRPAEINPSTIERPRRSRPLGIAIAGLGMMGKTHLQAYQGIPGLKIVAICCQSPHKLAGDLSDGWSNLGGPTDLRLNMDQITATADFRALASMPEVDVVDVCLPTPLHPEAVVIALSAGKHVVCEKPLALTSFETQRIALAASRAKGFFMPAMCMRFWPQWAWLKQVVDNRTYGRVLSASFCRLASMPPGWFADGSKSGGAILDLHVHDTDFVHYLFGPPDAVFSRGYSRATSITDHITTQYLYYGPGAPQLVTATGGWCMADGFSFTMRYLVNFERATATFDLSAASPLTVAHNGKTESIDIPGDGYTAQLQYFVDCVLSNKSPKIVTADDALAAIRTIEAERESIATERIVDL